MDSLVKRVKLNSFIGISFILLLLPSLAVAKGFVAIGTGSVSGVYYPAGSALCGSASLVLKSQSVRCFVESTAGSISNINAIRSGDLDIGIVQSDWQFHAYNGTSKFESAGAFKDLRSVMSLHSESFTVIARSGAGIKTFNDLAGKRVNVGSVGSGTRATMDALLNAQGLSFSKFSKVLELRPSKQAKALCENEVDAITFVAGHPSQLISDVLSLCDVVMVPITGEGVDSLVANNDFYSKAVIPKDLYDGVDDVQTFGVGATVVTSANVSDGIIYHIVKSTLRDIERFKKAHPAFKGIKAESMAIKRLSAPLHEGAIKAFKEAGLL